MTSADQALQIVLANVSRLGIERVPLLHALGRVLAEEIRSPRDIPGFRYESRFTGETEILDRTADPYDLDIHTRPTRHNRPRLGPDAPVPATHQTRTGEKRVSGQ